MNLTENFTLEEMSHSNMAVRKQIKNVPDEKAAANLKQLAETILEPIRKELGVPIRILSGYRCPTVNKLVGGAVNSQHMLGQAADTAAVGMDTETFYKAVKKLVKEKKIVCGQVIQEFNAWVHISTPSLSVKKNSFLRAVKNESGQTVYLKEKI